MKSTASTVRSRRVYTIADSICAHARLPHANCQQGILELHTALPVHGRLSLQAYATERLTTVCHVAVSTTSTTTAVVVLICLKASHLHTARGRSSNNCCRTTTLIAPFPSRPGVSVCMTSRGTDNVTLHLYNARTARAAVRHR